MEAEDKCNPRLRERANNTMRVPEAVQQTTARGDPIVGRLLTKPRVNELKDVARKPLRQKRENGEAEAAMQGMGSAQRGGRESKTKA